MRTEGEEGAGERVRERGERGRGRGRQPERQTGMAALRGYEVCKACMRGWGGG